MAEILKSLSSRLRDIGQPKPLVDPQVKFEKLSPEDKAYVDDLARKLNAGSLTAEDMRSLGERRVMNGERAFQQVLQSGGSLTEQGRALYRVFEGPYISDVFYRAEQMEKGEPPTS